MPFHFSQFLSVPAAKSLLHSQLHELPDFPDELQHCLVVGPERSGRTAVLFHYAYHRAAAGEHVTFCCRRQSVDFDPPVLPVSVSKDDTALTRIHIRYLDTLADLRQYGACLHLDEAPPAALIVDDLSKLGASVAGDRQGHDRELISTLSYLHDATQWAGRRRADGQCKLLVSELARADVPHMQFLYQRWCPCILMITGNLQDDAAQLRLAPTVSEHHDVAAANHVALTFSVARRSVLALEAIVPL